VHLLSFTAEPISPEQVQAMSAYCQRVETVLYKPFQPGSLKAVRGFFSLRPRSVVDTFNPEMQAQVERTIRAYPLDAVVASQLDMAPYAARLPIRVKVFEELELTSLYEQAGLALNLLHSARARLMWWKHSRYARQMMRCFGGCTVVSPKERELVRKIAPGYALLCVIPNGVDVSANVGDFGVPEADTLIYSGALTYHANFDAVAYFLREIWPLIQAERPNTRFAVTGKLEGVPVERLPHLPGVTFTGYLADVRPAVARSWVSVVPLRLGGGTRVKILEAMALGTPVVATSKGVEGLELQAGRDVLVADTPADFAAQVLRLLGEPNLRLTLSRQARQTVAARYDWAAIGHTFNQFLDEVGASIGAETYAL
jgi:glycosyltransferase involved in cell wall biosynthesis